MATEVIRRLVDDLDGSDADGTIQFSIDGITYEIDLNTKNAKKLAKVFDKLINKGRRMPAVRGRAGRPARARNTQPAVVSSTADAGRNKEIREWARTQGITLPARGRIPNAIRDQYEAEHQRAVTTETAEKVLEGEPTSLIRAVAEGVTGGTRRRKSA